MGAGRSRRRKRRKRDSKQAIAMNESDSEPSPPSPGRPHCCCLQRTVARVSVATQARRWGLSNSARVQASSARARARALSLGGSKADPQHASSFTWEIIVS